MCAELDDVSQIGELLVLITDKLVDLEYELTQLRRSVNTTTKREG